MAITFPVPPDAENEPVKVPGTFTVSQTINSTRDEPSITIRYKLSPANDVVWEGESSAKTAVRKGALTKGDNPLAHELTWKRNGGSFHPVTNVRVTEDVYRNSTFVQSTAFQVVITEGK